MHISESLSGHEGEIIALFQSTFTASEGAEEGQIISKLAKELLLGTAEGDIHAFWASQSGALTGAIIFSRLTYVQQAEVFVLGPVAVLPDHQHQGVGSTLIHAGLQRIAEAGVKIAMTYGDPAYYTRFGFEQITETQAPAPFPLQHPHGWLGRSLTTAPLPRLTGRPRPVTAFDDPAYW
ncbi:MAG: N-acetyltransferase [Pseudomonadota bacterium]